MGLLSRIGLTRRAPPPPAFAAAVAAPPLAVDEPPDDEPPRPAARAVRSPPPLPVTREIDALPPHEELPDLPPVLAEIAALRQSRPRVMRREVFAAELVAYLRREGFTGYHLADDIDEVARWLFDRHGIQPLPLDMVREAIAGLPGVTHERLRLKSRPELAHVAYRLKCKGSTNERPWLYRVSDAEPEALPVTSAQDRCAAAAAPPRGQGDRPATRPKNRAASRPVAWSDGGPATGAGKAKKHRTISDVRAADADLYDQPQRKVA